MTDRLTLGYRDAVAATGHPVWPAGTRVRGHEFHYSATGPAGPPAWRLHARGRTRDEGHGAGLVHASYLHTHWAATPDVAVRLTAAAAAHAPRAARSTA
jgi:cobyrinic acid a,c-diamide synthase